MEDDRFNLGTSNANLFVSLGFGICGSVFAPS